MVERQIVSRGVRDPAVLRAMRSVPRDRFVPAELKREAFADRPLAIGYGQTISQPYIVAYMTELARIRPESRVLEIGTGSAYQTAVLRAITPHVFTIEIVPELAERAARLLMELGYGGVHARCGNGALGWPEFAPFEAIVVTAAAPAIPRALSDQLAPDGRLIIPVGLPDEVQYLMVVHKNFDGALNIHRTIAVRFVPMIGAVAVEPDEE